MNLCDTANRYAPLIGRLLMANIFIVAGYRKIPGFAGTAGYMAAKMPGVDPNLITVLLVLTIIIELGGGLMLLFGWQARIAALVIFLWMIPVTLVFHAYWGLPPEQMRVEFIQFQKNMAIMGGMFYVMAFGTGRFSVGRDPCA
jgi:putative oxidoreductase